MVVLLDVKMACTLLPPTTSVEFLGASHLPKLVSPLSSATLDVAAIWKA